MRGVFDDYRLSVRYNDAEFKAVHHLGAVNFDQHRLTLWAVYHVGPAAGQHAVEEGAPLPD